MNKLPQTKRCQILKLLSEGTSLRAISSAADVSINTVTKMLADAGAACAAYHDEHVRNVKATRIQCEAIWSFGCDKQTLVKDAKVAPGSGHDMWTWIGLDANSKLMVGYFVGARNAEYAWALMDDLRDRLTNPVQLIIDGHKAYLSAAEDAFGDDIDTAMLVTLSEPPGSQLRPSPTPYALKEIITDCTDRDHASLFSHERKNLAMEVQKRHFTCQTNTISRKIESHIHAVALHVMFYNFLRIHETLQVTPAMAAGVTERVFNMNDIVAMIDARSNLRGNATPYKRQVEEEAM